MTVSQALVEMQTAGLDQALVSIRIGAWGWVGKPDLEKAVAESGDRPAKEAVSREVAVRLYPDVSLDAAMHMLSSDPILPVSSRANPRELLGSLTLGDIHRAYGIE
jgi:CBS domain-containing protein